MLAGRRREKRRKRSYTQIPDWILLNERINPTALRLWCILRSMQYENGKKDIPLLTIDKMCWLLPGINKKPTSKQRVMEALAALLEEEALKDVTPDGTKKSEGRRYEAVDEPQKVNFWSSARQKLDMYVTTWRKGT